MCEHKYRQECYTVRCFNVHGRKCMKKCIYCNNPYQCDGVSVGDQNQPYAECGLTETHKPHTLITIEG